MGSKRVGLARVQALIENLKRELNLNGSALTGVIANANVESRSATAAHSLEDITSDHTLILTGAHNGNITLPQATADNIGLKIKVVFAANKSGAHKLGFANSGSTVMTGYLETGALDAAAGDENRSFALASSCKALELSSTAEAKAGGAAGSTYSFTYYAADRVHVEAHGRITTGTPGPTADASSGTGI